MKFVIFFEFQKFKMPAVVHRSMQRHGATGSSIFCVFYLSLPKHTVRNLHFLSKNSTLISRENCRFFFWVKNSRKCCGFGLFSCWQLWFHEKNLSKKFWVKNSWKCCGFGLFSFDFKRKIVKKFLDEKLVKMLGCGQNRIFGQKSDF